MKVSIITVCYNSVATIRETLESVKSQSYPFIEYIIIDGLSKDGTLELIDSYKGLVNTLVSEHDNGIYDAMNKGLKMATGDIIGILNADDVFASQDTLAAVVDAFQTNNCEVLYGNIDMVDTLHQGKVRRKWIAGSFSKSKVYHQFWVPPHPAFFVLRTAYERMGSFNLKYTLCADQDLMLRALVIHQFRSYYLNKILVRMKVGGASGQGFTSQRILIREYYQISRDLNIRIAIYSIPLRLLIKIGQRCKAMLGIG